MSHGRRYAELGMRLFCSGYTVFTRVSSYADFILEGSEKLLIESLAAKPDISTSENLFFIQDGP